MKRSAKHSTHGARSLPGKAGRLAIRTLLCLILSAPLLAGLVGCGRSLPTAAESNFPAVDTLASVRWQEARVAHFLEWHAAMTPFVHESSSGAVIDTAGFLAAIEHTHPDLAAYIRGSGPKTLDGEIVSGLLQSVEAGNDLGRAVTGPRSRSFTVGPVLKPLGIYRVVNWGGIGALFTNSDAQRLIDLVTIGAGTAAVVSFLIGPYGVLAKFVAAGLGAVRSVMQYYLNHYGGYFIYCTWIGQVYLSRP